MGWRIATTFSPRPISTSTTRREVWLFPAPVRMAHTATTGFVLCTWVSVGPRMVNEDPAAITLALTPITWA